MQAVLIQQKYEKALKGEGALPVTMTQADKTDMVDMGRSAIVFVPRWQSFEGRREGTRPTAASVSMTQADKAEMVDKARSVIVFVPRWQIFEGCREGTNCGVDVIKVGVIVYDQDFGS